MSPLNRKLARDMLHRWMQVVAIALVMSCGVATIVAAVGAYRSLSETRSAFYERYRFATIFASATRAPLHLRQSLSAIDGINAVELRVAKSIVIDVEGMIEPAGGVVVSLPASSEAAVNALYLRSGRWPDPEMPEVAVLESFALANSMGPGSRLNVILNGRKRELSVTAIVLSPEYIYAIGPGDMVPDQRRFGVIFMPQRPLAALFDMEGAFNDVVVSTRYGSSLAPIIDQIDTLLEPYGGRGAVARTEQLSHAYVDNELTQLRAMAVIIPPLFLAISAFLVNMILTRMVELEREQVGLLKAVGYGSFAVAWHYAKLTLVIVLLGVLIGSVSGMLLGRGLTRLYGDFFSFPFLVFRDAPDLYVISGGLSAAAALAGSARAIHGVTRLPPAVAMHPPAPPRYRAVFAGKRNSWLSQLTLMSVRHLLRWPIRAALTTLGTASAVALLVTAQFSYDSVALMIDTVFFRTERQDATILFAAPAAPSALLSVSRLPGVMRVEGFRATEVVLRKNHREKRLTIVTIPEEADLTRVLDREFRPIAPPTSGLMVSDRVASILQLQIGDLVEAKLLEFGERTVMVAVTSIARSYVGLGVYMHPDALDRMIGQGPRLSGVRIAVDPIAQTQLYTAIKATPVIGGIALQSVSQRRFRETIEQNITIMTGFYLGLAVIVTFGIVYSSARIQLSEHARELASLRVLGFFPSEVTRVLLTELAVVVLLAQPLGWLLGSMFSWFVVKGFESDLFRIPFAIDRSSFAIASLVVIVIAVATALIVRWRIEKLDLIRVLKTRE